MPNSLYWYNFQHSLVSLPKSYETLMTDAQG